MLRNEQALEAIKEAGDASQFLLMAELARRYVGAHPQDPEGVWHLGWALSQLDCYPEARAALEKARSLASAPFQGDILLTLGQVYLNQGDESNAERCYKEALRAAPDVAQVYIEYATFLQAMNRLDEAAQCLREGIREKASPPADLFLKLGRHHATQGDLAKAATAFNNAHREDPGHADIEPAIEELRALAALRKVTLPTLPETPSPAPHTMGNMTVNIHREFFEAIVTGEKKIEYRDSTDYWYKRVDKAGPPPFHLRIINGMTKNAPELTVVVEKVLLNIWEGQYELHLGKIESVSNWNG